MARLWRTSRHDPIAKTFSDKCDRKRCTHGTLCHSCDSKPVLGDNTDCIDGLRLLILWNLLKTKVGLKFPAYRLIRHFF
jgi:hypothetical protein